MSLCKIAVPSRTDHDISDEPAGKARIELAAASKAKRAVLGCETGNALRTELKKQLSAE